MICAMSDIHGYLLPLKNALERAAPDGRGLLQWNGWLERDPGCHGVYFDGASHYYIDGTVSVSGRVAILAFDEETGKYRSI